MEVNNLKDAGNPAAHSDVRGGAVISAKDLDLTFQTNDGLVHALKSVSLDIEKGDFVSFIGPSGCGKTTFLRCMADLEQPTGGSITVNGVSAAEARAARAYGYVFQAAGLYPWRTIGVTSACRWRSWAIPNPTSVTVWRGCWNWWNWQGSRRSFLATVGRDAAAGQHCPRADL